ncbi:MAG: trehalose-phosphatase [Burkholderiales bacterium RIFCSPHIGHO2_12_FULL_69_20]|nr:MAG: trehalose-phosphatase [Burkholderiales bacterium RIFCSPHIGHO2_12_FULL_69_20]
MQHLFSPDGEAALAAVMRLRPLMAFDFDGTLAPIVARPDDARISQAVGQRLRALAARLPVAIITGRSVADVRERLGFEPPFVIGNHGAEDPGDAAGTARRSAALAGLRDALQRQAGALAAAGVTVEDKGLSIAMHYRLSRERERAQALIAELLAPVQATLHVFGGKMVVNAMAADAPDKAHAVLSLVQRSGAAAAFFAGDDVNDESVFIAAPPHWLTLRIGRDDPGSRARFGLDGPQEMALLLERILALLVAADGRQ